ncbi:protein O-mannosyl-transferase TMTC1 [Nephila pilipes]|uniref:Protein O-mannosyl-transferase TMTC1 n=1 Tax=Nephila pilipes TaxID=299642 RepID=A0A8X6UGQ2_NEPPI|nr:protein O-mannosyl-transferase TMTC1 [Nephila pilipes]
MLQGLELRKQVCFGSHAPLLDKWSLPLWEMLNWTLWGGVFSFHATNVFLHSVAVVLLLYFCREMLAWRRDASLVAALMFAAHPVHTEAVSNIVGRADVLCCVFYLSALIACSKATMAWQGASLVCAFLALFTKEQGITALGVCLVYHLLVLLERNTLGLCKDRAAAFFNCLFFGSSGHELGNQPPEPQQLSSPPSAPELRAPLPSNGNDEVSISKWGKAVLQTSSLKEGRRFSGRALLERGTFQDLPRRI